MTEVPEAGGSVKRVASAPAMSHAATMKLVLLVFATFATLFFVPCVFSMIHGRRARRSAQQGMLSPESA